MWYTKSMIRAGSAEFSKNSLTPRTWHDSCFLSDIILISIFQTGITIPFSHYGRRVLAAGVVPPPAGRLLPAVKRDLPMAGREISVTGRALPAAKKAAKCPCLNRFREADRGKRAYFACKWELSKQDGEGPWSEIQSEIIS
jgi:hypothetical protein